MKSRKIKSMYSMHTIDVEHNRVIHKLPTMTRMKKCKTCLKENKKHSERLWELHQEVRPCLLCNKKYETEYSGNANLKYITNISKTGINRISVGAITHSSRAFDSSLLLG